MAGNERAHAGTGRGTGMRASRAARGRRAAAGYGPGRPKTISVSRKPRLWSPAQA